MRQASFRRELSERFLRELEDGRFADLLRAAQEHNLDIQLRGEYVDMYAAGVLAPQLWPTYCKVYRSVLGDMEFPDEIRKCSRDYRSFDTSPQFLEAYVASFEAVVHSARSHAGEERRIEEAMIQAAHQTASSVILLDRQVTCAGMGGKADMVGLVRPEHEGGFVLIELKQGLKGGIPELLDQISQYYEDITADRHLRTDFAASYREVVRQKRRLGLLADDVSFPDEDPLVECLLVLYGHRLSRDSLRCLREEAEVLSPLPLKLVLLEQGQYGLPPREEWVRLS